MASATTVLEMCVLFGLLTSSCRCQIIEAVGDDVGPYQINRPTRRPTTTLGQQTQALFYTLGNKLNRNQNKRTSVSDLNITLTNGRSLDDYPPYPISDNSGYQGGSTTYGNSFRPSYQKVVYIAVPVDTLTALLTSGQLNGIGLGNVFPAMPQFGGGGSFGGIGGGRYVGGISGGAYSGSGGNSYGGIGGNSHSGGGRFPLVTGATFSGNGNGPSLGSVLFGSGLSGSGTYGSTTGYSGGGGVFGSGEYNTIGGTDFDGGNYGGVSGGYGGSVGTSSYGGGGAVGSSTYGGGSAGTSSYGGGSVGYSGGNGGSYGGIGGVIGRPIVGGGGSLPCPRGAGYYRHPVDCNRFYRCVDPAQGYSSYKVYDFNCPPGTVYSITVWVCVWPYQQEAGICYVAAPSPLPISGGVDSYGGGGGGGYSSGGGGGGYSSGGSYDGGYSDDDRNFPTGRASDLDPALIQAVDNMTTPPNKSAGVENATTTKPRCLGVGFFAHPFDCTQFAQCWKSSTGDVTGFYFKCPPKTVFNPQIPVCQEATAFTKVSANCQLKLNESAE